MRDISMHIMDIIQNSIVAKATQIDIVVEIDTSADKMTIVIKDNGVGMDAEMVEKVMDPFFTSRSTRRVGMGIPLFSQSAERSGGELRVTSEPRKGTDITAWFGYSHIDRPPMGNLPNSIVLCVVANPEVDFLFTYAYNHKKYVFDSQQVKKIFGDISLNQPKVIQMLTELIDSGISKVKS